MNDYAKIVRKNKWLEAAKQKILKNEALSSKNLKILMISYDEIQKEIEDKITAFYQKYAIDNKISISEAKKILGKNEFIKFRMSLEKYIKEIDIQGKDSNIAKELEILRYKSKISRLEELQADIYKHMGKLAESTEKELQTMLSEVITINFENEKFNLIKNAKIKSVFSKINQNMINTLLSENWNDKTFSKRVWDNTDVLVERLSKTLTKRMISGKSLQESITEFDHMMKKGRYVTGRLLYTESAHLSAKASLLAYDELNVEKYMYIGGTEGSFTCNCALLNGVVFDRKSAREGVNLPPMHPWCKCVTVPYFDDNLAGGSRNEKKIDGITVIEINPLENDSGKAYNKDSGALSGALNDKNDPTHERREKHAIQYYDEVRNRNIDNEIEKISGNANVSKEVVEKAYRHIFINKYELENGLERFYPDYDMAQSWQRLFEGKNIQKHDLILLQHEAMEFDLMNNDSMHYIDAHKLAESKYNYNKALNDWLEERDGA